MQGRETAAGAGEALVAQTAIACRVSSSVDGSFIVVVGGSPLSLALSLSLTYLSASFFFSPTPSCPFSRRVLCSALSPDAVCAGGRGECESKRQRQERGVRLQQQQQREKESE